jgi:hypothetical protein
VLNVNTYLVKQHAGLFKRTAAYDIFDAETKEQVGSAKEEPSRAFNVRAAYSAALRARLGR